jgi:sugar lactone lactonase YvrE
MVIVESIGNPNCRLGECPIWNESEQALYWTDILAKRLWRYDRQRGAIEIVWQGEMMVGGFAFTGDNGIVLCTEKGVYKLRRSTSEAPPGELELLFEIPMAADERFNDITTDPRGRVLAGTLTDRRVEGVLYRLERGKNPIPVLRDIGTSNGMTFSLDQRYFYHTDSHVRTIRRYDYDIETGAIGNPEVVYEAREENGVPDGITMDSEGCIWVACYRGGKVVRIDSEGRMIQEVPVPAIQVSSVAFGGASLNELYITSACQGASDQNDGIDSEGRYLGGAVFRAPLTVTGRIEWRANL